VLELFLTSDVRRLVLLVTLVSPWRPPSLDEDGETRDWSLVDVERVLTVLVLIPP
jgi:hypothetical protein